MMKKLILFLMVFFAFQGFAQDTHTINFEVGGTGADWEWIMDQNGTNPPLEFVNNPVSGGINTSAKVAKFVAQQAGQPWALTYTDDDGQFEFDATNNIVKIMVYKEVSSPVGIKFEGLSPAAEILVTNTLTGQWQELTFDFSAFNGNTYSRLIVIPDFVARTQDNIIYFDNIQVPDGEEVGPLPEPTTVPPIPDHEDEDVFAIYTEVYDNLPGVNFNPFWGQSTVVTLDYPAAGNNTLKYENLNYQGTELPGPQNVSLYEKFHLDFWTPNATQLQFTLISPGPNEKLVDLDITLNEWVSVDIDLQEFVPPVNLNEVFQFKVVGNGIVYFDNWYFWKEPTAQGTDATLSDLKVNDVSIPDFSPLILSYDYKIPFGSTTVPTVTVTTTDPNATSQINPPFTVPGTTQIVVTAQDGSTQLTYAVNFVPEPSTAPDPPTQAQANVLSFYSEAYTNVEGINFDPFWGQGTEVTLDYSIAGNNTLMYENLDFQGTEFPNQDVSGYDYLHVDFWTSNSTELIFFLISPGSPNNVQQGDTLEITPETWVSVDMPLSAFSPPVDLTDIFQFMVTGNGDVWFDNWYFWKEPINPQSDATLSDLTVDGETVPGFSPDILGYSVELPFGTTDVPVVDAVTTYEGATYEVDNATQLPGTTEVVVTSEDETNTLTYTIEFTVGPEFPLSDYCETEVTHFGGDPGSAIYLTIANVDANTMIVEIESADADPVDLLLVEGGSGAVISEQNTTIPGKISRTMTWAENPPTNVDMNVLWSKVSAPGNWQLIQGTISQPFLAGCGAVTPTVSFNPFDGETGVELTVNPVIVFSVAVEKADGSELTNADLPGILTFTEDDENGQAVAYTATINDDKTLITIVPDSELDYEQDYYLALGDELIGFQEGDLIPGESVTFTTRPEAQQSEYCYTETFHFGGDPASGIYLTIANLDPNSMIVEIESNNDDPVDLLLVTGGSGAAISEPDTLTPGVITVTMTWAENPPTDVIMNVLWSKESFGGNWMLSQADITQPFEAGCEFIGPPPVEFFPQDGATEVALSVNPTLTFSMAVEKADGSELTNADLPGILTFTEDDINGQAVAYSATINAEKTLITIVPDAELAGEQLFYLALGDELIRLQDSILIPGESVTFTTETAPKPYLELDVQDNFEDDGFATIDNWKFQDGPDLVPLTITEDPVDPTNNVADYNRTGTFLYTNAQVILDHRMDLSERNEFELRVYFPASNNYGGPLTDTAAIKLQNSLLGPNAYLTQTEVLMPVNTLDAWQTLVFDFSAAADSVNYDQIVVQLGGENHLEVGQFYFDDLVLLDGGPRADFSATPLSGQAPLTVQFTEESNFNSTQWQWDFDNDGTVDATVKNPQYTFTEPGSYTVKLFARNPFIGNDEEIKENYITVEAGSMMQTVTLSSGWSGISSYVIPDDASIESIFGSLTEDIEIMVGDDGIYFPSQGINTIVNWNSQEGYIIKMTDDAQVSFSGADTASPALSLPQGWSVVPVTVSCEVDAEAFLSGYPQVMAVKDIAGGGVYWPEKSINTLQTLVPGHAYYFMTTEAVEITYPECSDGYQLKWSDDFD